MRRTVPSERLIERALAMIVQGEIAPSTTTEHARLVLDRWSGQSAEHAAAFREARERWETLGGMADGLRAHFEEPEALRMTGPAHRPQRRKMLLSIAALLGTGLVGRGLQWVWEQPIYSAAYETRTAQMLKATLADGSGAMPGSRLAMAPQSALTVALYRRRRVIELARGEVHFDVAPDKDRPLEVRMRSAVIEVVGTAFTVRDRGGPISVGVEHGHVRVRVQTRANADGTQAQVIDLHRGERVDIADGYAGALQLTDPADLSAWRKGWLVFENTPLGEALATVNSYRARPILSNNAHVDAMRLSGRFRSGDSNALIAVLPTILPLIAVQRSDGSVELQAR